MIMKNIQNCWYWACTCTLWSGVFLCVSHFQDLVGLKCERSARVSTGTFCCNIYLHSTVLSKLGWDSVEPYPLRQLGVKTMFFQTETSLKVMLPDLNFMSDGKKKIHITSQTFKYFEENHPSCHSPIDGVYNVPQKDSKINLLLLVSTKPGANYIPPTLKSPVVYKQAKWLWV